MHVRRSNCRGVSLIDNDFHDRKDLSPNVCAVYTEEAHRGHGIAGNLLPDVFIFLIRQLQRAAKILCCGKVVFQKRLPVHFASPFSAVYRSLCYNDSNITIDKSQLNNPVQQILFLRCG